jgi:tetratricopeptide (TPR) repeat protein
VQNGIHSTLDHRFANLLSEEVASMTRLIRPFLLACLSAILAALAVPPTCRGVQAADDQLTEKRSLARKLFEEAEKAEGRGDHKSAVAKYSQARELFPDTPLVAYRLGCALQILGENAKAVAAFRAFLTLDPTDSDVTADARARLAQLLIPPLSRSQKDRLDKAQDYLIVEEERHNIDRRAQGGQVVSPELKKATELLESFRSEVPDHLPLYADLGRAYEFAGDKQKAYESYKRYVDGHEKIGDKPADLRKIRVREFALEAALRSHRFNALMAISDNAILNRDYTLAERSVREAGKYTSDQSVIQDRLNTFQLMEKGGELRSLEPNYKGISLIRFVDCVFSSDGRLFAVASIIQDYSRSEVRVWDTASGKLLADLNSSDMIIDKVGFNLLADELIAGGVSASDPTRGVLFRAWNLQDGKERRSFAARPQWTYGTMSISNDGQLGVVAFRSRVPNPPVPPNFAHSSDAIAIWNLSKEQETNCEPTAHR